MTNINDSAALRELLEAALRSCVELYRRDRAERGDDFGVHRDFILTMERWNALRYGLEQDEMRRSRDAH